MSGESLVPMQTDYFGPAVEAQVGATRPRPPEPVDVGPPRKAQKLDPTDSSPSTTPLADDIKGPATGNATAPGVGASSISFSTSSGGGVNVNSNNVGGNSHRNAHNSNSNSNSNSGDNANGSGATVSVDSAGAPSGSAPSGPPFICPTCSTSYSRLEYLRRHERRHADIRPFVCECGKGFSRSDVLSRHKRQCKTVLQIDGGGEGKEGLTAEGETPPKPAKARRSSAAKPGRPKGSTKAAKAAASSSGGAASSEGPAPPPSAPGTGNEDPKADSPLQQQQQQQPLPPPSQAQPPQSPQHQQQQQQPHQGSNGPRRLEHPDGTNDRAKASTAPEQPPEDASSMIDPAIAADSHTSATASTMVGSATAYSYAPGMDPPPPDYSVSRAPHPLYAQGTFAHAPVHSQISALSHQYYAPSSPESSASRSEHGSPRYASQGLVRHGSNPGSRFSLRGSSFEQYAARGLPVGSLSSTDAAIWEGLDTAKLPSPGNVGPAAQASRAGSSVFAGLGPGFPVTSPLSHLSDRSRASAHLASDASYFRSAASGLGGGAIGLGGYPSASAGSSGFSYSTPSSSSVADASPASNAAGSHQTAGSSLSQGQGDGSGATTPKEPVRFSVSTLGPLSPFSNTALNSSMSPYLSAFSNARDTPHVSSPRAGPLAAPGGGLASLDLTAQWNTMRPPSRTVSRHNSIHGLATTSSNTSPQSDSHQSGNQSSKGSKASSSDKQTNGDSAARSKTASSSTDSAVAKANSATGDQHGDASSGEATASSTGSKRSTANGDAASSSSGSFGSAAGARGAAPSSSTSASGPGEADKGDSGPGSGTSAGASEQRPSSGANATAVGAAAQQDAEATGSVNVADAADKGAKPQSQQYFDGGALTPGPEAFLLRIQGGAQEMRAGINSLDTASVFGPSSALSMASQVGASHANNAFWDPALFGSGAGNAGTVGSLSTPNSALGWLMSPSIQQLLQAFPPTASTLSSHRDKTDYFSLSSGNGGEASLSLDVEVAPSPLEVALTDAKNPFYIPPHLFRACYSIQHWSLPPLSRLSMIALHAQQNLLKHFPVIHEPTFRLDTTPGCLAFAVCMLGSHEAGRKWWAGEEVVPKTAMHVINSITQPPDTSRPDRADDPSHSRCIDEEDGQELVKPIVMSEKMDMLMRTFASRCGSTRDKYSVVQALMLFQSNNFLSSDSSTRTVAAISHGSVVTMARHAGFFDPEAEHVERNVSYEPKDVVAQFERELAVSRYSHSMLPNYLPTCPDDEKVWRKWCELEGRRRTAFVIFVMDTVASLDAGIPTLLRIDEVEHLPLPSPDAIWRASTSQAWQKALDSYRGPTLDEALQQLLGPELRSPAPGETVSSTSVFSAHGPFARLVMIVTLLRGIIGMLEGRAQKVPRPSQLEKWFSRSTTPGRSASDHQIACFKKALSRWRKSWDQDETCKTASSPAAAAAAAAAQERSVSDVARGFTSEALFTPLTASGATSLCDDALPLYWLSHVLVTHAASDQKLPLRSSESIRKATGGAAATNGVDMPDFRSMLRFAKNFVTRGER
ncbi:hypothetical protein ACQY0O_001880 [Thecaphora frezii]